MGPAQVSYAPFMLLNMCLTVATSTQLAGIVAIRIYCTFALEYRINMHVTHSFCLFISTCSWVCKKKKKKLFFNTPFTQSLACPLTFFFLNVQPTTSQT